MTEKTCFVISPIGEPDSSSRKKADDVYNYVIRKVVEPLGYTVVRSDGINASGLISPQIIEHLKEDSLVIAYLAENNPNVFFELAIRYVTKKPYIQMKEPIQKLPFDIKDTRTIDLDITELKSVEEAKESLKEQINSLGKETPNPIVASLDNLTLQGSKDPTKNVLGEIMNALSEIRQDVSGIDRMPSEQEAAIRSRFEENILQQIGHPIDLLRSALDAIKANDKLSKEDENEIKKIEEALQGLYGIQMPLIGKQRTAHRIAMIEKSRQAQMEYQRAMMEEGMSHMKINQTSNNSPNKGTPKEE